jgi:hypothetical protein
VQRLSKARYSAHRYLLVALWGTTFLPAKPVLWTWFCQLWVFKVKGVVMVTQQGQHAISWGPQLGG